MAYIQNSAYHPGDSILHSIGARSKILLALVCIFVTGAGGWIGAPVYVFFVPPGNAGFWNIYLGCVETFSGAENFIFGAWCNTFVFDSGGSALFFQ